jgi:hypothetical protein
VNSALQQKIVYDVSVIERFLLHLAETLAAAFDQLESILKLTNPRQD